MTKNGSAFAHRRGMVISAMKEVFGEDARRIGHALEVLGYAEAILARESGEPAVVVTAAVLHDIGIREAERKHGSSAGRYQEIEGPPIAREIMHALGFEETITDHVCRIIANHHSAHDIDTPEFRIVWDADWLVNLRKEHPNLPRSQLGRTIERVFKTSSGKNIARSLYLADD